MSKYYSFYCANCGYRFTSNAFPHKVEKLWNMEDTIFTLMTFGVYLLFYRKYEHRCSNCVPK